VGDVVDPRTRSRMMAGIQGKNTKQEVLVRSALHRRGFRFHKNDPKLPGKPDIVLPRHSAIIECNGCFWHMHSCALFRLPATNTEFWQQKLSHNRERDNKNLGKLHDAGWRTLVLWECALKGKDQQNFELVMERICKWIQSDDLTIEIMDPKA